MDEISSRNDLAAACSEEDYERARELLAVGRDPVSSRAGYFNWSPLHYSARHGQLDFAQMLISQYGCHSQVEDKEGRTPLHIACQYGQLEFVQYLVQQKRCDASYLDIEDQTPLHHTCGWLSECTEERALEICRFLIMRGKCDPGARDMNGKSCVLHACEKGFLSVLKYFLDECNCPLSCFDYNGNNALHLAVSFSNNFDVVNYIMSKNVLDIECRNSKGNNVLHMAAIANSSTDICKLILDNNKSGTLLEYNNEIEQTPLDLANRELHHLILTRFHIHREHYYDKFALNLGVKQSPVSPYRVFVVGDSESGKTTLIRSLLKEGSSFSSSFSLSFSSQSPVPQTVDESRGLNVTCFESKVYGNVAFYDFSGHRDYTCIQEQVLQLSIHPRYSIFIVVVDLFKPHHEIHSSLCHWLGFLSRSWHKMDETPKVIIVGTHSDVTKSCSKSSRSPLKSISFNDFVSSFGKFEYVARIQVDFHKSEYSGVNTLRKQLGESCVRGDSENGKLSFNASCLLTYLNNRFSFMRMISLETLLSSIELYNLEDGQICDVRYFLSDDVPITMRLLESLDKSGHIGFLVNETDIKQSLVIIKAQELFSDLTCPWNPYKIGAVLNSLHLVSLSSLAQLFPDEDVTMILQVFSHLKMCIQVYVTLSKSSTEQDKQFYFPCLLSNSPPKYVWDVKSSYEHNLGWIVEVCNPEQSFSSHVVHSVMQRVLLLVSIDLSAAKDDISLWKNGFYLRKACNNETLEVIVEAFEDLRAIFLITRSQKLSLYCLKFLSTIVRTLRECLKENCSCLKCVESFMDPFDTMQYPLPSRSHLTLFNVSDVSCSMRSNKLCVNSSGVRIPLDKLFSFDIFVILGSKCLSVLQSRQSIHNSISADFLLCIVENVTSNLSKKFLALFFSIFSSDHEALKNDKNGLHSMLVSWVDSNKTYSDFVELLKMYSLLEFNTLTI